MKVDEKMVESLNSKVDLTMDATSYLGMPTYGKLLLGDKGFEYYNERKVEDYIQIPWDQVDKVIVSVVFGGRWIPRYAFKTKQTGTYVFASKKPTTVLRAVRKYIKPENIVKSLSFVDVIKQIGANILGLFRGRKPKKNK